MLNRAAPPARPPPAPASFCGHRARLSPPPCPVLHRLPPLHLDLPLSDFFTFCFLPFFLYFSWFSVFLCFSVSPPVFLFYLFSVVLLVIFLLSPHIYLFFSLCFSYFIFYVSLLLFLPLRFPLIIFLICLLFFFPPSVPSLFLSRFFLLFSSFLSPHTLCCFIFRFPLSFLTHSLPIPLSLSAFLSLPVSLLPQRTA